MNTKEWDVLKITGNQNDVEILCAKLENFSYGVLHNSKGVEIYIKPKSKKSVNLTLNESNYDNLIIEWAVLKNRDWHLMWQKHFDSIIIRDEIQILPDWEINNSSDHIKSVFIRPGMSFGTGHHETTYLMLESLLDYKNKNLSLLDLGSGSGILSIAANKLGYSSITSVEYDKVCKDDFQHNSTINNCNDISINWMDATLWKDFNFDLILANIEKNILKKILKNINQFKGVLVLSGLLIDDKDDMKNYLYKNNFIVNDIRQKNEWIAITCSK